MFLVTRFNLVQVLMAWHVKGGHISFYCHLAITRTSAVPQCTRDEIQWEGIGFPMPDDSQEDSWVASKGEFYDLLLSESI